MAQNNGYTLLDENIGGVQSAFVMGGQQVFGSGYGAGVSGALPGQGGSSGGVPDNASVSGDAQNAAATVAQSAIQSGQEQGSRPAWNQPVFWAVVSSLLGLFILAHLANLHLRG